MEKLENITDKYQEMKKIEVGSMVIGTGIQRGRIWLQNAEGEGGDFPPEEVEKVLLNYFDKNF